MKLDGRTSALLGLALLGNLSCSGGDGMTPSNNSTVNGFDRGAMLKSISEKVILPTYRSVATEAAELETRAQAYADAVTSGAADVDTRAEALRASFHATVTAWQRAEVMQVGPAGSSLSAVGGGDLRDEIYSWPTVNACRVDQKTAEEAYDSATFFEDELVNAYGLDALEYLLFAPSAGNVCPPQLEINDVWDGLGEEEITRRRAVYAARIAGHVRVVADQLVQAWSPDGEDFVGRLGDPARTDSPYGDIREATDELFHAMYYVEGEVKDLKLAVPTGISVQCPAETCAEDLESKFADRSRENIVANLRSFRALFRGELEGEAEGMGFDDFLVAVEAGELATQMDGFLTTAIDNTEAMQDDLRTTINDDPERARQIHAEVKAMTDLLKSQFVTVLNLSVPQEGAADND